MNSTGGRSAFPSQTEMRDGTFITEQGMSLRDYFAAKSMRGMLANKYLIKAFRNFVNVAEGDRDKAMAACVALSAYNVADAMLAERNK